MRKLAILFAVVGLVSCSSGPITPVTVPLQYKAVATPAEFSGAPACAAVSRVDVTDRRSTQDLGTRYQQEKSSESAAVTSSGDVTSWLRGGIESGLKTGGVTMKSGAPTLRISLDSIKTDESVYRRAQYNGRINMTAELVSSSGRSCWKSDINGASENYGYAGSAENYQETLNHALDRAVISLLNSSGFKNAVCSCQ